MAAYPEWNSPRLDRATLRRGDLTGSILNKLPTDLRRLEAESIYIFREVAAEFAKPVLLYSIGKDSSVLLHLARKGILSLALPFPLLHIDTTWKFREMIRFRDETAARLGLDLIVHVNRDGIGAGHQSVHARLVVLYSRHEDRSAEAGAD